MQNKQNNHYDEESPLVILTHLYRDVSRTFSEHVGMSFSRLLVLHELMHEGEMSQAQLQKRLGMEGALITRFAKQMEEAGLVSRRVDPKDNRFTLIRLAPAGQQLLDELDVLGSDYERRLLEGLSQEDQTILVKSMKRILGNLNRWYGDDDKPNTP